MVGSGWQLQSVIAAAMAGPTIVAGLLAYAIAVSPKAKAWAIVLVCGLAFPTCVLIFAWLTPLTRPDPRSIDGPAYVLAGLISWALLLTPACLVSSVVGTWLRRRSWRRSPTVTG